MSTIECLVRRFKETRRFVIRPWAGRPCVISQQDYLSLAFAQLSLNCYRNCPYYSWHSLSPSEMLIARCRYLGMSAVCRSPLTQALCMSYGIIDGTCSKKIFDEAMEMGPL